jgi:Esterase PHB depolymerase
MQYTRRGAQAKRTVRKPPLDPRAAHGNNGTTAPGDRTMPRTPARFALAVSLVAVAAGAVSSADVIVLKDGFTIQGFVRKEIENVVDKASGQLVPIAKGNGVELVDEGPKITFFTTYQKQLGGAGPDVRLRPDARAFTTQFIGRLTNYPIPFGTTEKVGEFSAKWVRTLSVKPPGFKAEEVRQQITHLDPYYMYIVSPTHLWRLTYRTNEQDPKLVRKLLLMHPELAEPDGKCDPLKRFALAKFMLDAGWLQYAKDELDRFKVDFVGDLSKDAKEQFDKLRVEIDHAAGELVAREAEFALRAGRYKYTADLIATFPEKTAAAKEVQRLAKVTAELKTNRERYDAGRRFLRALVDELGGNAPLNARAAVAGGLAFAARPAAPPTPADELAAAGERVLTELHPDSALRIETFVTLAAQAERERAAGKKTTLQPDAILAAAVSGWARGKNAATPNVAAALRMWTARELVLEYQSKETMGDRTALMNRFKRTPGLDTDELAQIISILPPAEPEDLDNRAGQLVPMGKLKNSGVYRRTTRAVPGFPQGLDYLVRLPPEYHHGRAYPVLVVLTTAGIDAENLLASLVTEADKHGYILVVPEWTGAFGKGWQWRGEDHVWVTGALRDAIRHFTIDNDRVFLTGVADGANMAMDVGLSHPDLFAGVIPMGPIPKWYGFMIETWRNAQYLPFYIVTGEQSGEGLKNLKLLFDKWGTYGFPVVMSVYKGRGIEWFASEVPVLFDWMSRKTRVTPAATLKLDVKSRQQWQMLRSTDTRFYWLEGDRIEPGKLGGAPVPALMQADVRGNNLIDIQLRHVKDLTVWLSNDMIDWAKPVRVQVNGSIPRDYKARKFDPSLEVLLEDYAARGDRRRLFMNKLTLTNLQ